MAPEAYCFHRIFEPAEPAEFRMERHYFLYAREGTLRLQAEGSRWTLPPARAAFIPAGHPVVVSIHSRTTSASVLFSPDFYGEFPQRLSVFEMSALSRELVTECMAWGADSGPLPPYARRIFQALAAVVAKLAESPSPCVLPIPKSPALTKALALTEELSAKDPDFEAIARATGQSSRTLARRFAQEMGMTWSDALRRIRVIRAVEALANSDRPITTISMDVGYNSVSAFNTAFRSVMGTTPSQYRSTLR